MTIDLSLKYDLNRSKKEGKFFEKLDLEKRLSSSSKQAFLRKKISFQSSELKFSTSLKKLRSKYNCLNRDNNPLLGKDNNGLIISDGLSKPKVVLFPTHLIKMKWQNSGKIGPGLTNLRNTCFLNATLQCLTYTPPLANYFLTLHHSETCKEVGFCVMCELQNHVIRALQQPNTETIRPMVMVSRIKYIGKQFQIGHQEDAHELLCCLKEVMQKNCLAGLNVYDKYSKETTVVQQIFGGYYRSRVNCDSCHSTSDVFEPFFDVTLDIKNSSNVFKAFSRMIQPEKLEGENCYMCKTCGIKVTATKRLTIQRLPNILCIVFKRFDYDVIYGRKINKHVSFSDIIDMSPYTSNYKGEKVTYSLYAVLVHQGVSCHSGHYYSYVKSAKGFWYKMDDSSVSQASLKEVLKQEAYILFYTKNDTQCKVKSTLPYQIKKQVSQVTSQNPIHEHKKDVLSHPLVPYTEDSSDSSSLDTSDYDNIVAQVSGFSAQKGLSKSEQANGCGLKSNNPISSTCINQNTSIENIKTDREEKKKVIHFGEDAVQVSPSVTSIASDSSSQSLCSTGGEWVVLDRKDQFLNVSKKEYSHPGWKVEAQNDSLLPKITKNRKRDKPQFTNNSFHTIYASKNQEKNHKQNCVSFKFKATHNSSSVEGISGIKEHKKCNENKQYQNDKEHPRYNYKYYKHHKHENGEIKIFPQYSSTTNFCSRKDKVFNKQQDWNGDNIFSRVPQHSFSWDNYNANPKGNVNGSPNIYEHSWPSNSKPNHIDESKSTEKRNYDEYDEEYDKGKVKKIKLHHQSDNSYFTENKFQKMQNFRNNHFQYMNRKGSSKM